MPIWKAIDFDISSKVGVDLSNLTAATAANCCPEIARFLLAKMRGAPLPPLFANTKMDSFSLGITVYEIANGMKSFWTAQGRVFLFLFVQITF